LCRKELIILSLSLRLLFQNPKFDLKIGILIRKSIEHRLGKDEVIEMLTNIGYDKSKAKYLVNDYYKKRSKEKQMKLS